MIEKWPVTIPELTGKRWKRNVYVYLPRQALEDENARFPVLYMFDGHNVFFDEDAAYGKSWGMGDYLDATDTGLIVAAVECSHKPPHGRLSEYSPWTFSDSEFGRVYGRGELTMRWMTDVLKPMIDSRYPTLPQRECTFIAGSSMGGLMSLYALLTRPDVYGGAAALSPSLWTSPRKIRALARLADIYPDSVLYTDFGSCELARSPVRLREFGTLTSELISRGMNVTARIVPGGEHCEASWQQQLPFMVPALMYQLNQEVPQDADTVL